MQRAARVVAVKNEKLLALLALRGVKQYEIDAFLDATESDVATFGTPSPPSQSTAPITTLATREHSFNRAIYETNHETHARDGSRDPETVDLVSTRDGVCAIEDGITTSTERNAKCRQRICAPSQGGTPVERRTEGTPAYVNLATCSTSEEVTSCDTAATILANFHGHGDVSEAREVLGCSSSNNCSVKNTHLFQLMDEVS